MGNNFTTLSACTTLLVVMSAYGSLAIKNGSSRSCAIGVIATAVSFGFTPWIALWNRDDGKLPIGGMPVILTYVGIALFCASVLLIGRYLGRLPTTEGLLRNDNAVYTRTIRKAKDAHAGAVLIVFLISLSLRMVLLLRYSFVPTTTGLTDLDLPYIVTIFSQIIDYINFCIFIWSSVKLFSPDSRNLDRTLALAILIETIPFAFLEGRRVIIEHALILQIGFLVSHKLNFKFGAFVIAFILLFHYMIGPVYLIYRINFISDYRRTGSYGDALFLAGTRALEDTELFRRAEDLSRENLGDRPLIMRFNSDICDAQITGRSWLCGAALWSSFATSIPRFLLPSKDNLVQSEILICRHFGIDDPEIDTSSNLPAYGMADFGLLGCALYGCLWALSLIFLERLAWLSADRHPLFALATLGTALHIALSIESDSVMVWASIRNILGISLLLELSRMCNRPIRTSIIR